MLCAERLSLQLCVRHRPRPKTLPQRRPAVLVSRVDIDLARAEQQLDDGLVPVLGCLRQRRPAIFTIFRVDVDLACPK